MGTIEKVLFEQKVRLTTLQTVLINVGGVAAFAGSLFTASEVATFLLIPSFLSLITFTHFIRKAQVVHRELYVFRDRGLKCKLDGSEKSKHLWPNPSKNAFKEMGSILLSMFTRRPYTVKRNSDKGNSSFEYHNGNIRLIHNLTDIEMFEHGFRESFNVGQDSFETVKEDVCEEESERAHKRYEIHFENFRNEGYHFSLDEDIWLERELGEELDDIREKYEAF